MEKKFLGLLGVACVACCAGPLLALIGISTAGTAAVINNSILYLVLGGVTFFVIGFFIFKKYGLQSNCTKNACITNCSCKSH